jgi:hypothetical protein
MWNRFAAASGGKQPEIARDGARAAPSKHFDIADRLDNS